MKVIIFVFLFISHDSFSQENQEIDASRKLLQLKIDSLNEEVSKLKIELNKTYPHTTSKQIENWLFENLKIKISLPESNNYLFSPENYSGKLNKNVREVLSKEEWLGKYEVGEISSNENGIVVQLSFEDLSKTLVLTKDYFVISYHWIIGSNSEALIYDFGSESYKINNEIYAMDVIGANLLLVGKDYYDNRDIEDPNYEGHIFENGSFFLENDEYIFITKE